MRFTRWLFCLAGLYGGLVLLPYDTQEAYTLAAVLFAPIYRRSGGLFKG